ncbi:MULTISPECIES: hypothetical protein [unclassified Pseudomonas]|uniref:hypothetical protein n=1 Tax=unclassified Pseudomonas TaxID=196821 RepID=UPI0015A431F1|nr:MULTISPECIES: hypothetical protein [unclassified Pseudomonas]NWC96602.1 hypothetical protein [Pseudomonas sp. IPO3779]NWD19305.1 hypothetical protein [Pseudomonas sp. IPO3778]
MIREELAQYGGITVMIPAAVVIAVWLWYSRREAVKWWLMTVAGTYSIVAFSKLLFKGWGVSLQHFDIAVLSGHAMNTSLMVPVAISLVARRVNPDWRWPAAVGGMLLAGVFSAYCVAPFIHPLNEALAGGFLGGMAALAFLWRLEVVEVRVSPSLIGGGMVILLLSALVPKYNAEKLLNHVAVVVSGADQAHQEPSWRASPTQMNAE